MFLRVLPAMLVVTILALVAAADQSAVAARATATQPSVAAEHGQFAARIEECGRKRTIAQNTIGRLQADLRTMRDAIEMPGMDSYIGPLLNERRRQLPDVAAIKRENKVLRDEANAVQIRYLMLEDDLRDFKKAAGQGSQATAAGLQTLKDDYKAYWRSLAELSVLQERLLAETQSFARVIDEHALWLPSARPLYSTRWPTSLAPAPGTWGVLGESLRGDVRTHPVWYASFLLVLVIWAAGYGMARAREARIRELVLDPYSDSFRLTTDAIAIAIYQSAALPALLWFCGVRVAACVPTRDDAIYEFGLAISFGLQRTALFLFFVPLLRRICRQNGVAHLHFRWDDEVVRRLHKGLSWLIWIGIPAAFCANLADYHPDSSWRESVGRLAGLVALIALAVFADQLLRPGRRMRGDKTQDQEPRQVRRRDWFRYLAVLAVPVALAVAMLTTYPHTAGELARHIFRTLLLLVALVMARSLIIRFVRVSRDRLSIEQAKRDRAHEAHAGGEAANEEDGQVGGELVPSRETIDHHATTLLRWLSVLGLAVGVWIIWRDIFPALSLLGQIELWAYSAEGGAPATVVHLSGLLVAVVATFMTVVLARDGPAVLETAGLRRLPLDDAARFAMVTIIRYVVVLVGVAVALGAIGLGWSRIHWLAAGITVGLGFGLQEIFANFVSGLIILFERPVRIGDIVTVGGVDGKVTRIRIRATTVIDGNRRELIVPNKEFITGQIINWTLSDPVTRVAIPIGIAYGSNTRLARDLLLRVAAECRHVLEEPAPAALFKGFGDSTLDFELGVCIPTRDVYGDMIHELHTRIDDEFRKAGIEIAFPQRGIHIRSMPEALRPAQPGPGAGSATSPAPKGVREMQSGGD
jgi:potassium-dependent mechanosensitive channel